MKANKTNTNLIQCSDHTWAPWSIICIHLITGSSREWQPLDSTNPEIDHDWLCPQCMKTHQHETENNLKVDITPLRAICIHCVRSLRTKYDQNYNETE